MKNKILITVFILCMANVALAVQGVSNQKNEQGDSIGLPAEQYNEAEHSVNSVQPVNNQTVAVPQWKDVAPAIFQDIDTQTEYKVPLKKYWQDRRKSFDTAVARCQERCTDDKLKQCFDAIVSTERSKNEIREQMYVQNARSILNDNDK